jgi:formylglycine-generating enzyme required for sulfatase activity
MTEIRRLSSLRLQSLAVAAVLHYPATAHAQITMDTVAVADPGNPPDTNGLGSVARRFRVGTFEVTNDQYVVFLNAVADSDPNGLFNEGMTDSDRGGINRSGAPGSYTYQVKPDFDDKPVNWVSWYDAARFCNWLHHGQPAAPQGPGTTEDGAYDMAQPGELIARGFGAKWFLPTHDEWYKTAYYDPLDPGADAGGTPDYWFYPTRSDASPAKASADAFGDVVNPGPNLANYDKGADWNGENGNVTTVGGCEAVSRWGTFDLAGNINEMTETPGTPIPPNPPDQPDPLPTRRIRGGDFANTGTLMGSPAFLAGSLNMLAEAANIGFRVARPDHRPTDLNGDGTVGVEDFLLLLAVWGPCPGCPEDLDDDGEVGITDFLLLLGDWGP